jgi:hypothetical protein
MVYIPPEDIRQVWKARMSVRVTSPGESVSHCVSVMYAPSSRRHTNLKDKQEKKRHEELDTG